MEHLVTLGLIFLNLFMLVGTVDLFYYHIWKYKLHTRPESRYEHKLHMAFAFLMVPKGVTCVYDPETNRQTRLPDAKIPPLEEPYNMNFNMVYDARHGVFLLVTGSWRAPPVVWALRLDPGAL